MISSCTLRGAPGHEASKGHVGHSSDLTNSAPARATVAARDDCVPPRHNGRLANGDRRAAASSALRRSCPAVLA